MSVCVSQTLHGQEMDSGKMKTFLISLLYFLVGLFVVTSTLGCFVMFALVVVDVVDTGDCLPKWQAAAVFTLTLAVSSFTLQVNLSYFLNSTYVFIACREEWYGHRLCWGTGFSRSTTRTTKNGGKVPVNVKSLQVFTSRFLQVNQLSCLYDKNAKDKSANDTSAKPTVRMPTVRKGQQCEETRVRMSTVRMPAVRCDIGAKKVRQQCE